ncbi:hypothetical protein H8788_12595 [Parabacteroides faecis]|uniref:hypothetical protein n=1 Tax=Parabacteroides TaxID=375288 RepID=UPI000F003FB0|nr:MULTISPECIES: hypothetical protein [Parabacteroides]MBC8618584.1 hypothetical protein [Parabacteroides faecis]RHR97892.1 hypothetical protein DWW23_13665 [Parabacteroides sp. AF14-59]
MNRINTILEKERTNTDNIFLYLQEGRFTAFGRSAYYAVLLCPKLAVNWSRTDAAGSFVCIRIPDDRLCSLLEKYSTLADDECIRITPPLNICRQWDYFAEWEERQLYLASKIDIE